MNEQHPPERERAREFAHVRAWAEFYAPEPLKAKLIRVLEAWMTPFDGSGRDWHESLPSSYTYQPSDFSKLVVAVHEYEAAYLDLANKLAEAERERLQLRKVAHELCGFVNGGYGDSCAYAGTLRLIAEHADEALRPEVKPGDGECLCGEINARHCPEHG